MCNETAHYRAFNRSSDTLSEFIVDRVRVYEHRASISSGMESDADAQGYLYSKLNQTRSLLFPRSPAILNID